MTTLNQSKQAEQVSVPSRVHGFADGELVRNPRTGGLGWVRILAYTDAHGRVSGYLAEVEWDGARYRDPLDIAIDHGLERARRWGR